MTVYHGDAGVLAKQLRLDALERQNGLEVGRPDGCAIEEAAAVCIRALQAELMDTKRIVSAAKWFATYIRVDATMSGPVVTGVDGGAKDEHGVGVNRAWSVLCGAFAKCDEEPKK